MDGEDDTVLLHQVEIDMEKIDVAGNEKEYPSNDQWNKIKGDKKEKIADSSPKIIHWLILPVAILHISKNIRVRSIESSDESQEICKRNDDLKALTDDKNLYALHKFLNIFFCGISFGSECPDDKVEVDNEINSKKDVKGEISGQTPHTDGEKDDVVGDCLCWSLLLQICIIKVFKFIWIAINH